MAETSLQISPTLRESMTRNRIQIVNSAAETTLLAATAGEYHDLLYLQVINASGTASTVTLRDTTGGTAVYVFNLPASGSREFVFGVPLLQAAVNTNWTVQLSAATITVDFLVTAIKNR